MTISAEDFKRALSRRASGVAVVTTKCGDRIHGMTVSAFTEVSLDPPLVLVCADKGANTLPVIREGGVFAINVLARGQQALSSRFAAKKDEHKRFDGLAFDVGRTGAPLLRGVAVNIDCRVVAEHDAGDHVVYIGQVEEVRSFDHEPLLYFRGAYGRFEPHDPLITR
ncbi:MAG TPA: flavin reductase family protein [Myxococcota bacterium]|nr:flavin reductase family protein [Myxococcota bacterium]